LGDLIDEEGAPRLGRGAAATPKVLSPRWPPTHVIGRPLLLSRQSTITERFTRVAEGELFYRFTVEDAQLYSQPRTGEFSMIKQDGPMYEYACHEGNYSLANILRGGQAEAGRRAATKRDCR
jgi:hypothetical protein